MNEKNIPQAIYHLCSAVLCICISIFVIVCAIQAKKSGEAIGTYFGEMSAYQAELQQQAVAGTEILSEVLAYTAARGLEQANMLAPTDANRIAGDAISSISDKSETWGKIASGINDGLLRQQGGK